jgi:Fe-S oxidoreductase
MDFNSLARAIYWFTPGWILFLAIHCIGIVCFCFIVAKRLNPLLRSQRDLRFDRPLERLERVVKYWLGQWRHPRYPFAGFIHILIFGGFLILASRALTILGWGISDSLAPPELPGLAEEIHRRVLDYATTIVFLAVSIAAIRRVFFRPKRYERSIDALFLLGLIALLMLSDSAFEASRTVGQARQGSVLPPLAAAYSLPWAFAGVLKSASLPSIWAIFLGSYLLHQLTFFFLLCYRPFGIQFHVETSLFSVFFAKLDRGTVKPVRWGISDAQLDQVKSFGVKTFEDFTWKHILDFYSCADCGRCAEQCPANSAGRPLSPKRLTTKARDYCFDHFPVFAAASNGHALVGTIYSEDEIWSCTTCGACEAECPLLIEYIDKIVDLRRGLVDEGNVPQTLQKPLKALENRGNPFGKPEKKRGDWIKSCERPVKVMNGDGGGDTLYFVDSATSYDERLQSIARATAGILDCGAVRFGILGAAEKDSGHDVRRFGEELLYISLRDHNTEAIRHSGARRIITADPHAYNALKHDYNLELPVEHISEFVASAVRSGRLKLGPVNDPEAVYTYHDPCYLGRHNGVYDAPRSVLDAMPGMTRVEMSRCKDRSFCCGGGGLALFYEPKEEERIGVQRVRMAADAGANRIITACPFCMVNIEDAIKVAGFEGKMRAIDFAELVYDSAVRDRTGTTEAVTQGSV